MTVKQQGVSLVCVFNNPEVRRDCLDRSIAGRAEIDFIPVDNTAHAFTTAGAALNHGARKARHDVVIFVHQDVYLHSIDRLLEAAALLRKEGRWGMLGALGVTSAGALVGRIRDRVQLLGRSAPHPVPVDSLDEVLFMVRRNLVLEDPLSEHQDLAWHTYAVEYGLRVKAHGLEVGAVDLAITHNSMTTNLARLDVAHRKVAAMHPGAVPVRTTCGTVGGDERDRMRTWPVIGRHGWRYQWLQESLLATRARWQLRLPAVICDIRRDVDLLEVGHGRVLHVVNVDGDGSFAPYETEPLRLLRRGGAVCLRAVASPVELVAALREVPGKDSALVTHLSMTDLAPLRMLLQDSPVPALIGVHDGMLWLVTGPAAARLPSAWQQRRAIPLGGGGRVGWRSEPELLDI
ncbi:glycosyl transferase family 2 [Mesorhizobium sp. J18]|uniref:glycosyltransferase n=1 Tax=Mesorhizobium sp. J18 TaxID=935263 RepID=UPI00119AF091|nr:glycosyltransferase [Mesorhizobium sp. J18]TWG96714.1 glycosyl transferase family 2 [Mesorhizobium sp. J18]